MYRFYLIIILFISCSPVAQARIINTNNIHSTDTPEDTIKSVLTNSKANKYSNQNYNGHDNFENNASARLFVKVSVNKPDCYVGESILATYKLYSRVNSKSKIIKQPRLAGFSVYDMFDMISIAESNDTIMGIQYKVHTIRKARLVPLQAGPLNIDAIELENTVRYAKSDQHPAHQDTHLNEMIDELLKEETAPSTERVVTIKSKPVTLTIKALPELNKPLDFTGAVGRFTIRAGLSQQNPIINEVDTLRVELKGNGNWEMIDAPEMQWPTGIESLDVRTVIEPVKNNSTLEERRFFEYPFILKKPGKFTIPRIRFSFFDPGISLYQTIGTSSIIFEARLRSNVANTYPALNLPVAPKINKTFPTDYFNSHVALIPGLLFLLCFLIFISRKKLFKSDKRSKPHASALFENIKTLPASEATPIDPLLLARSLADNPNYMDFYAALQMILWNLFSEKLQLQPTTLNKSTVLHKLRLQGWNEEKIETVDSILTECERTLYLPKYQSFVHPRDQVRKAEMIVTGLQNLRSMNAII